MQRVIHDMKKKEEYFYHFMKKKLTFRQKKWDSRLVQIVNISVLVLKRGYGCAL